MSVKSDPNLEGSISDFSGSSIGTHACTPMIHKASCNDAQNTPKNSHPLGILTKSSSTPEFIRFQRYLLQNQSSKLLPKERVRKCLKNRIDRNKNVEVMYNKKREKAHYSNLQRCGSIWTCPVCAANISEKRKHEVKIAIDKHLACGGGIYLMTLTVPHYSFNILKVLLAQISQATRRFFGGTRASRTAWADIGKVGHIKALEVTYGSNGWHPHFHTIVFTNEKLPSCTSLTPLVSCWIDCVVKSGLPAPSHSHGFDWRGAQYASQYINKWGIEHEVTKSHLKQGKLGSLTPWDILKHSMIQDYEYSNRMAKLFQEFAISFKGKRQLVWSKGLKSLYGIDDKSDEELSEETEKLSQKSIDLELYLWLLLKQSKSRADFLTMVEYDHQHNTNTALEFLISLVEHEVVNLRSS